MLGVYVLQTMAQGGADGVFDYDTWTLLEDYIINLLRSLLSFYEFFFEILGSCPSIFVPNRVFGGNFEAAI